MPQRPRTTANAPRITAAEKKRLRALNEFEDEARCSGFLLVAGVDEAGRGPLAGPVVAAVCLLPEGFLLPGINDSKQLTAKQRADFFELLTNDERIHHGVGIIHAEIIDAINIYQATLQAMLQAVEAITVKPDYLLVDGMPLPHPTIPSKKIIKGDEKSQSIACASVIAKETRDRIMLDYHQRWPVYGFDSHKGYGTERHLEALDKHGPCPIHRRSYAPVAATGAS